MAEQGFADRDHMETFEAFARERMASIQWLRGLRSPDWDQSKHHPRLAMSVYHEPSHPTVVPELVKSAWSGYRMECGPCAVVESRIRPDIMYFQ